jgi:hypothetical protein
MKWLSEHKFQAHLTAFLLMILSSIGMILLMRGDRNGLIWLLVAVFAGANLLAVFVK